MESSGGKENVWIFFSFLNHFRKVENRVVPHSFCCCCCCCFIFLGYFFFRLSSRIGKMWLVLFVGVQHWQAPALGAGVWSVNRVPLDEFTMFGSLSRLSDILSQIMSTKRSKTAWWQRHLFRVNHFLFYLKIK